jgi:hypothetical protein
MILVMQQASAPEEDRPRPDHRSFRADAAVNERRAAVENR